MAQVVETLIFKADTSQLDKAAVKLRAVGKAAEDAGDDFKKGENDAKGFGNAIKGARFKILAFGAALTATALVINRQLNALQEVGSQLSLLEAQLVTATGSVEAAGQAFDQLNEFALKTPFTLDESIRGFTLLKNLGLNPSEEAMTSFANTSAAMGTSLEQMIEAVADATTNEFERLKQFGIKSKQEGDKVTFTFQGVETEVVKSASAIQDFLVNIGNTTFAGAAIAQTQTLAGSVSNLEQAFFNLKKNIGDAGAFETFRQTNEGIAESIKDPKFIEGMGIISNFFAEIAKSVKLLTVDAFKGFIDFITTTEDEATQKRIKILQERIDKFQQNVETGERRLAAARIGLAEATTDREKEIFQSRIDNAQELIDKNQQRVDELNDQVKQTLSPPETIAESTKKTGEGMASTVTNELTDTPKVDEKAEAAKAARQQAFADELTELQVHELRKQELLTAAHEKERQMFADKYTRELEMQVENGTLTQEQMDALHLARMEKLDAQHEEEREKLNEQNTQKNEDRFAFDDASNQSLLTGRVDMLGELEKLDKQEMTLQKMTGKQKKKLAIGLGGQLLSATAAQSKKGFEVFKAAQLAEAIISGHKSIQNSYEKGSKVGGPPVGAAFAAVAAVQTMAQIKAIKAQQFQGGGSSPSAPGGGGGAVGGVQAAEDSAVEPLALADTVAPQSEVNITIDGAIDPSGTRRIIEAINEATEDGLQINALVGS